MIVDRMNTGCKAGDKGDLPLDVSFAHRSDLSLSYQV